MKTLHLTNTRKVLKGNRYKRGKTETRGRKMKYTKANVFAMNKARKALIKTNKNEREVRWEDVRKKARVKAGHRTTLLNAFRREKDPVAARCPREKPQRTLEIKAEPAPGQCLLQKKNVSHNRTYMRVSYCNDAVRNAYHAWERSYQQIALVTGSRAYHR